MNRRSSFALILGIPFSGLTLKDAHVEYAKLTPIEVIAAKYFLAVANYINDVKPFDEKYMRQIEYRVDIPEVGCDDFRRSVMAFIGTLFLKNKDIAWDCNPTLAKAFMLELENEKET